MLFFMNSIPMNLPIPIQFCFMHWVPGESVPHFMMYYGTRVSWLQQASYWEIHRSVSGTTRFSGNLRNREELLPGTRIIHTGPARNQSHTLPAGVHWMILQKKMDVS